MKRILMMLVLSACVTAEAFTQTVDEIVSKYMAAVGGDKWKDVVAMQTEATMSGGNGMEMAVTTTIVKDKAYKWELNGGMFQMARCLNGDEGWSTNPRNGGAAEAMPADQAKLLKDQLELPTTLFDYKAKGHTAELIGKEDMNGTEVYKIKLTKKTGGDDFFFLDAQSFLIVKKSGVQNMMGRETPYEVVFSNYKDIKDYPGLKIAYTTENKNVGGGQGGGRPAGAGGQGGGGGGQGGGGGRGGFGGAMTLDKVKINPKIKDNDFKMPK